MTTENALIDSALRTWKQNITRGDKFFLGLTEEVLQKEIAPGKNRLIYLLGHLIAVNDGLLPLLGLGERLYPELDEIFLKNPDRAQPDTLTGEELKVMWTKVHDALEAAFGTLSAADWVQRHTAVSEEAFVNEPHRNRFTVLLSRTGHLAYHFGQVVIA